MNNNNASKILDISHYLENLFKNKILYYFQLHSTQGHEYPVDSKFVASNTLEAEYKEIYNLEDDFIELRFLCETQKIISTQNKTHFLTELDKQREQPLFFVFPYFDQENKTCETFYACTCGFEIQIRMDKDHHQLQIHNHTSRDLTHIEKHILEILDQIDSLGSVNKGKKLPKETRKYILPTPHIEKSINKARDHMIAGDCYLANITHTQKIKNEKEFISPQHFIQTWLQLKSRYGIFYCDENVGLSCFSPERFLRSHNGLLAAEPIKGTLPFVEEFQNEAAKTLWSNQKEIYEHTLVVDLLRHDLNSICKAGSVVVFRPFYLKKAQNLLQMQSSILGTLKDNTTVGTCFLSMLPAGSITGTPKKKVCEMIKQQEQNERGYYTGVCGMLEPNGNFDSCILIRSLFMGERGVYFGVGSGITTLSQTNLEIEEFYAKLNSFSPILECV